MPTNPPLDATPAGAIRDVDLGNFRHLLEYPDGTWRYRHSCKPREGRQLIAAPQLHPGQHRITVTNEGETGLVTVRPSILCSDCDEHGFVNDSIWSDA